MMNKRVDWEKAKAYMRCDLKGKFSIIMLPIFIVGVFGPTEIFFGNTGEIDFVWKEFGPLTMILALILSILITYTLVRLPRILSATMYAVFFGLGFAMYIQGIFMNGQMELMGASSDGMLVEPFEDAINMLVWIGIVIVSVCAAIMIKSQKLFFKVANYIAMFLIAIQLIAMISLIIVSKPEELYRYPTSEARITADEQYTVSGKENIIVIILDMFSENDWESLIEEYPEAQKIVKDFTFYTDYNAEYSSTFPSVVHMLTGEDITEGAYVNEWTRNAWDNEECKLVYKGLQEKEYKTNIFETERYIYAENDIESLSEYIDNIEQHEVKYVIDKRYVYLTMMNISLYKYSCNAFKPLFYEDKYSAQTVKVVDLTNDNPDFTVAYNNWEFLDGMAENGGLTVDYDKNYFIVQHLKGMHDYVSDINGRKKIGATKEENAMGCMNVVGKYLEELKSKGVYDKSTIIITSDHCHVLEFDNVLFLIKENDRTNEEIRYNAAPLTHDNLLPTVACVAHVELPNKYNTIYDFDDTPADFVERRVLMAGLDKEYPLVGVTGTLKNSGMNVYTVYKYKGGRNTLNSIDREDYAEKIPMGDSLY